MAPHGRVTSEPPRHRVRLGANTGGYHAVPRSHRGKRRGRAEPLAGPLVRLPLRRGRGLGGDGSIVPIVHDVHVGDGVSGRWKMGLVDAPVG